MKMKLYKVAVSDSKAKKSDSSFFDSYKDILKDFSNLNSKKFKRSSTALLLVKSFDEFSKSIQYAQARRSQEYIGSIKRKIEGAITYLFTAVESERAIEKEVEVLVKKIKAIQPEIIKIAEEEKGE